MKKRMGLRVLSLLLAAVLVGQQVPQLRAAGSPEEAGNVEAEEAAGSRPEETAEGKSSEVVVGEVVENRAEREKHFRMEDGSFLAVDYGVPVHYEAEEEWEEIDNTLIPQAPSVGLALEGRGDRWCSTERRTERRAGALPGVWRGAMCLPPRQGSRRAPVSVGGSRRAGGSGNGGGRDHGNGGFHSAGFRRAGGNSSGDGAVGRAGGADREPGGRGGDSQRGNRSGSHSGVRGGAGNSAGAQRAGRDSRFGGAGDSRGNSSGDPDRACGGAGNRAGGRGFQTGKPGGNRPETTAEPTEAEELERAPEEEGEESHPTYNRNSVAQISYPDRKTGGIQRMSAEGSSKQASLQTWASRLHRPGCGHRCGMRKCTPGWTWSMSCTATM